MNPYSVWEQDQLLVTSMMVGKVAGTVEVEMPAPLSEDVDDYGGSTAIVEYRG